MFMRLGSMKRIRKQIFLFLIIIFSFLFSSCSVEKNRKILNIFFDGVPEKKENVERESNPVKKRGDNPDSEKGDEQASYHPDFKDKKCSKCHNRSSSNFLVTEKKKLCLTCHKEELFDGKFVHGPVAVRACNTCHDPHQSKNRKLLLEDNKKLCELCHITPVSGVSIPCKGDNCLECHDPHKSEKKYLLLNEKLRVQPGNE